MEDSEYLFDRVYAFLTGTQKRLRGKCQTQLSVFENGDMLFGAFGKENNVWLFYNGMSDEMAELLMKGIREFFGF